MHALLLLAQQQPNAQPTPEELAAAGAALGLILIIVLVAMAVQLGIAIAVCAMLYMNFTRIPPEHRKLEPALVWLLLIPLFNLIWLFFAFPRLADSYRSYFEAQGRTDVGDCGRGLGLWFAICFVAMLVPCLNYVAGPAALILLILFLVKVFSLRSQIPVATAA